MLYHLAVILMILYYRASTCKAKVPLETKMEFPRNSLGNFKDFGILLFLASLSSYSYIERVKQYLTTLQML